jgi:hypothetical protein
LVSGILHGAGRVAAITINGVFIVANLAGTDGSITADDVTRALASRKVLWACPVALDLACPVAPVAWHGVAVIAGLDPPLVVDAVAAALC